MISRPQVAAILLKEYSTAIRRRWRRRPPVANVGDGGSPTSATDCEIPQSIGAVATVANIGDCRSPTLAIARRQHLRRRPLPHNRCAPASQSPATANRGAILLEDYSGSVSGPGLAASLQSQNPSIFSRRTVYLV
ncbi:hypothetical protein Y032_0057g2782 [Ancylostoma ceylanicum]|uniref:Uncharacterized protein n=1 Tax=Ancylostoma ceylanicum TaxID=53326 RepID=A0A016U4D4_9BILA|nr:hypothetical protein Y032_0057g2782 [Ancylostoma ceylanicum]